MAVARKQKQPSDAKDIIKDPMYLGFLGLKREASYYERDLEQVIIMQLQDFLLELGNGTEQQLLDKVSKEFGNFEDNEEEK